MKKNYLKSKRWIFFVLFPMSLLSYAQQVVKGSIIDAEDGSGLPGVTVIEKGTTNGTVTDIDGNYSVSTGGEDAVLVFSFVGYLSQEVSVGGKTVIDIKMKSDYKQLDEVVVVGYGSQRKKEVTGAVASISAEDIVIQPTADVGEALQGRMAGVNVQASSGRPGQGVNIQIRGLGSLNGSNPLYVVDGIPFQGTPNIAPEQIKTIDILKDGASAAIYGVRASNGVVLITTKRGTKGKMKVSFTAYGGIQNVTSGIPLNDSEEQLYVTELRTNTVGQENTTTARNQNALWFNTDFVDFVTNNNASIQNYAVTVSGGQENLTFSATTNYFKQDGILINSGFDRLSTRLTGEYKLDKFRAFFSVGLTEENREQEPWALYEFAVLQDPFNRPVDQARQVGTAGIQIDEDINLFTYGWLARILNVENETKINTTNYAMNMEYEIIKGLKVQANLGRNTFQARNTQFRPQVLIYDPNGDLNILASDEIAFLSENYNWSNRNVLEGLLNYKREFGDHSVGATVGLTYERFDQKLVGASVTGLLSNETRQFSGGISGSQPAGTRNTQTLAGKLARVTYDYKDKYLVSLIGRRDGSSNFAKSNRYENFWGASAGWNIAEEGFFPSSNVLTGLKVRASYGRVGNQLVAPYSYIPTVEGGVNYPFGVTEQLSNGTISREFANNALSWETAISRNIGLDGELLDGKLQFTFDYYENDKEDMILNENLPPSTGTWPSNAFWHYNQVAVNAGDMTNKGIEAALSYNDQTSFGLEWGAQWTFTRNRNKVTNLNGKTGLTFSGGRPVQFEGNSIDETTFVTQGHEAGAFFLYKSIGIAKTQEDLDNYWDQSAVLGDMMYIDQLTVDTDDDGIMDAGDGVLDDNDRVYAGSGQSDFETGLALNAKFKGFDLFVQTYTSFGADIYNGSRLLGYISGRHRDLNRMWTPQNPTSDIPRFDGSSTGNNVRAASDYYLEDGTYTRIRNITLGYTIPDRIIGEYITKARFYFTAMNPFTFTEYTGYDPEVGGDGLYTRGVDISNYPVARRFLMGVQVEF
ncbi:MAG: TonB-dependent receptor [Cyclobacteriaceae bacterium]